MQRAYGLETPEDPAGVCRPDRPAGLLAGAR